MSGIMQLLLASRPQAVPDPYFEYTTLLLPGNGTNGAQNNTFLDSSTNNFTITRNGNTTQGTFSPFSQTGWGNYFDGTGDYLSAPSNAAFALPGDFTFEAWIYPTSWAATFVPVFTVFLSPTGGFWVGKNGSNFVLRAAGVADQLTTTTFPTLNTWTHLAVVRSGTTATIYYNGVSIVSGTVTYSFGQEQANIASDTSGNNFPGYISNLRLVKGTAVYTGAFTPPTAPLTAISGTSLLTCQSNRFIDNSTNAFAITRNGDVSVQAFSPFNPTAAWSAATNGGSGYFDGSGDYLTAPSNAAFAPGTGNFTVEAWVYPTAFSNYRAIFDTRGTITNTGMDLGLAASSAGVWGLYKGSAVTVVQSNTNLTLNTWQHVAAVRSGSTVTLYLNGVNVGSNTDAQDFSQQSCFVGTTSDNYAWQGYIASLRFVKGTAVYTSAFTPPTSPVTAITNTSLLLNFTNAGIYDATSKNDLETVGNAQISTTQSKFGGSSMYFDGTGDYLYRAANPNPLGSGDWTIEFWYYQSGGSSYRAAVSTRTAADGGATATVFCGFFGNNMYYDGSTSGGINVVGSTTIVNSTWYHCAYVRFGSTVTMYLNGVSQGSVSDSNNKSNPDVWVGGQNTLYYLNGYINDLRITKGYARYTANFTAPTAAFPLF